MLIEPQLKGMSVDDLNQRYGGSYINYNDEFVDVLGFHSPTNFSYNGRSNVPFDWRLVNIERLPSRWYELKCDGKLYAAHFAYKPSRQYSRGLSHRNTYLFCPGKTWIIDGTFLNQMLKQAKVGCPPKKSFKEVLNELSTNKFCILNNQIAISNKVVYYRITPIGEWNGKELYLENSNFTQELAELGLESLITYDPLKKNPPESKEILGKWYDEVIAQNLNNDALNNELRRMARIVDR